MKKFLPILLILAQLAYADFQPTTSKVTGDSTDIVSFNYRFPNFTGTHTGVVLSLGVNSIAGGGTGQTTANAGFGALAPSTTKGDLLGYSTVNARIPVGTDTQVLTADSAQTLGLKWATPTTGTVTSVTFTGDGTVLSSTPSSAVTTSGTLTAALKTQTARTFLQGPTSGAAATPTFAALVMPTIQRFSGAPAGATNYSFIVSVASATVGATYTNSGQTFTVLSTISGLTTLFTSGTGTPAASGSLIKSGGTGDSTITFTSFGGVYVTPTNPPPLFLDLKLIGGGGGGAAGGTSQSAAPTDGGSSSFGGTLLVASGGSKGVAGGAQPGGVGGSATINSPAVTVFALSGGNGGGTGPSLITLAEIGGYGANSFFGGGGASLVGNSAGVGVTNTGSGGAGGGTTASSATPGSGGGAGAYIQAFLPGTSLSSFYAWICGSGGNGGTSGGNGYNGGNAGNGNVVVQENY